MSLLPIQHTAFSGGVLAPAFWGRSDIENFDRALAESVNFYIDYRGGAKNRPGTRYLASHNDPDLRFWTFAMGAGLDDFLLIFTDSKMRIMLRGSYVTLAGVVLELGMPYSNEALDQLRFDQKGLTLTITHVNYPPREVIYNPLTGAWTTDEVDFTYARERPSIASTTSSAAGTASFVVAVTAVDKNGRESLPSRPWVVANVGNFGATAGWCKYMATKVAGARKYRWYRSPVADGVAPSIAQSLGFIGESKTRRFVDNNIIPDFSRPPPISLNPFANKQILSIDVGSLGSGYLQNTTHLSKSGGPGGGLIAYPVVDGGQVDDIMVLNWGANYDPATTTFSITGAGTGATIGSFTVSPSNPFPKHVVYFQQRRVFAASDELPTGVWGSEVGDYTSFAAHEVPLDSDGFQIYADIPGNDYISHIMVANDSILLFHSYGVDRIRGGQARAITPNSNIIEPQSSLGSGPVLPVKVNNAIIYASPRLEAINALQFTDEGGGFIPADLSVYVKHLFTPTQQPKQMVWQPEPDKVLWIVMTNGRLLSLTYVPEQEVYAWAEHETAGTVLDMVCVREQSRDTVYLFVKRFVGGLPRYFIEMLADRRTRTVDDAWYLDAALDTPISKVGIPCQVSFDYSSTMSSTFEVRTSVDFFASDHIGRHIRALGALLEITNVPSARLATGVIIDYPPNKEPYKEGDWYNVPALQWSLDELKTTFDGMDHLAYETVSVLADGNVYHGIEVNSVGVLTLPTPHSRVLVGLPYSAWIKSLPLTSREAMIVGKLKRIVGVKVRINLSRGLEAGDGRQDFAMRDTTFFAGEENLQLQSRVVTISLASTWQIDNHIYFRQDDPLPAEVLGYVLDVET